MLTQQTLEKINAMKLSGLAEAFQQQLASGEYARLSFEERLGLLIDSEFSVREQRKLNRRLRAAKLRYPASLEDVDFKHPRGLDRQQVLSLGNCGWVQNRHNLLLTGPTGIGKSYLACALVERAWSNFQPSTTRVRISLKSACRFLASACFSRRSSIRALLAVLRSSSILASSPAIFFSSLLTRA